MRSLAHAGLGLIPGRIVSMQSAFEEAKLNLKVPQIGWNRLTVRKESPLVSGLGEQDFVYYVHSYFATDCQEYVIADSDYGLAIPGIVQKTMSSVLSSTQKKWGCRVEDFKSIYGGAAMKIFPAIDLLDQKVVRLYQGDYEQKKCLGMIQWHLLVHLKKKVPTICTSST